jgi:hypothetical protein
MSRVASNYPAARYTNGVSRSSSTTSTINNVAGRSILVRSAAPPPVQKETVHACPLCNGEYKDPRVLPCTHTYCLNCIRDKLLDNTRLTCPKCQHQVSAIPSRCSDSLSLSLSLSLCSRFSFSSLLNERCTKEERLL